MFDKVIQLNSALELAKEAMKNEGRLAISEACQDLLAQLPGITAIRWRQSYPWCDGDTSYFAISGFHPVLNAEQLTKLTDEEFEDDQEAEEYCTEHFADGLSYVFENSAEPERIKLVQLFSEFETKVMNDTLFETVFGSRVIITAFRDGAFSTEPYTGDY